MLSVCFVFFVYRCDLAIRESAQLGSSGAARTLVTVSVTVTTELESMFVFLWKYIKKMCDMQCREENKPAKFFMTQYMHR